MRQIFPKHPQVPPARRLVQGLALALSIALSGCGHPAGTACQIRGSGFTASHDCAHRCLSRWTITCPDGTRLSPNTCSGAFDCTPGSCPAGQVCYSDDDPFEARSYCVMADTCGTLDPAALHAWELDTLDRQTAVLAERDKRQRRRLEAKQAGEPLVAPTAEPLGPNP